jgi:hypothetical protein
MRVRVFPTVVLVLAAACSTTRQKDPPHQDAVAPRTMQPHITPLAEATHGVTCGQNRCAAGEFCCNESCGICAPQGGFCTQQICTEPAAPDPVRCKSDVDCRLVAHMCTGCDCLALAREDPDPVCPGEGVQCLVDPCRERRAVCRDGGCELN